MRGVGEGHRAWDLTPDSTMTNATVEAAVTDVAGRVLTLTYKDGKQELVVPPGHADRDPGAGRRVAAQSRQPRVPRRQPGSRTAA